MMRTSPMMVATSGRVLPAFRTKSMRRCRREPRATDAWVEDFTGRPGNWVSLYIRHGENRLLHEGSPASPSIRVSGNEKNKKKNSWSKIFGFRRRLPDRYSPA